MKLKTGLNGGESDVRILKPYTNNLVRLGDRLHFWHRLLPFVGKSWDAIYFPWNSIAITYQPLFDLGTPVVLSCRGTQINITPHDPKRKDYMINELASTFKKAKAVHCVSHAILNEAQKLGLNPQKAKVIPPAVDPDFFFPLKKKPSLVSYSPFRLITVGSLNWKKGYEYMLQALRYFNDQYGDAYLQILGDGDRGQRQRLLYTVRDLNLEEKVTFLWRQPPEQIRSYLQQADVFVLASLSEGISNSVLEAMACGLPVVTTNCGGMKEAVTDGVEGFVVPIREPEAMAQALGVLLNDAKIREQMGEAGRQKIIQDFTLDQQVESFIELVKSIS